MNVQTAQDLFFYELCTMYDAEQKLVQILPELAKESQDRQVSEAFLQHQQETEHQVQNLEQCFQILGRSPMSVECHTVAGLKKDHDNFAAQKPSPEVQTMFNIAAGSKSEHLEIATYQGLIQAANMLGYQQCVPLFQQNLQQEEATAKKLEGLARQFGQQHAHAD